MCGWIKLHRQLTSWEWYDDHNTTRLFIHCLLRANFEEKKWRGISIGRGQFWTSLPTLQTETGLSASQIRTSLNKLKSTDDIAVKSQAQGRMITISNYNSHQQDDRQNDRLVTDQSQTDDRQIAANKNVKNDNKEKKTNKTLDQSVIDRELLFEKFWLSGVRKVNKKKAQSLFNNLLKKQSNAQVFTEQLIFDVQARLNTNQLGFAEMHPTTYLNGERWNDEVKQHEQHQQSTRVNSEPSKQSLVERVAAKATERARQREVAERGRGDGREGMAETNIDVRLQVCEPVRRGGGSNLGDLLDGSFTEIDC